MSSKTTAKSGSKAVIILGAGASADFGVPTLSNMFSDNHAREYLKNHSQLHETLEDVFWTPRGHSINTCDQSVNVEQILTIIKDMEKEPLRPPGISLPNMADFKRQLYCLIQQAVFEGKSSSPQHLNPLIDFCRKYFTHTTWASFNWDCIFEASFWYSIPFGLGIGTRENPSLAIEVKNWRARNNDHLFLKLHGGINWWLINDEIVYLPFSGNGSLKCQ
ncbi:hypothetical protein [Dehalococcoides mccartyi]|uniref:hypothetical protein n=1 Tax=Dehalococcoides mccartyi TaxID=61435 RepID=UPI0019E77636|nr:hypothetical protein [Dehalococcoides mccartyi]MBF4482099.1 hypothetical protein [Dehalococcoides mccartyi]MBJ7531182.1 hypothetical protein [Dehalococcoides mccartyi]